MSFAGSECFSLCWPCNYVSFPHVIFSGTLRLSDITQTVKGGMEVSYRALVVVGNLNGVGGFAMGKSSSPADAVIEASR